MQLPKGSRRLGTQPRALPLPSASRPTIYKEKRPLSGASAQQHYPLGRLEPSYATFAKRSTSIADVPNEIPPPSHPVAVYVDGLNLYHGLKS